MCQKITKNIESNRHIGAYTQIYGHKNFKEQTEDKNCDILDEQFQRSACPVQNNKQQQKQH